MQKIYTINRKQLIVLQIKNSFILNIDLIYCVIPDDSLETCVKFYKKITNSYVSKDHIDLILNHVPQELFPGKNIFNLS